MNPPWDFKISVKGAKFVRIIKEGTHFHLIFAKRNNIKCNSIIVKLIATRWLISKVTKASKLTSFLKLC